MADILLPIKEFPRCCSLCPCFHAEIPMYCHADRTIKITTPYDKRMEGCPITELPPHETLKDYKVVKEEMEKILRRKMKEWGPFISSGFRYALEVLDKIAVEKEWRKEKDK